MKWMEFNTSQPFGRNINAEKKHVGWLENPDDTRDSNTDKWADLKRKYPILFTNNIDIFLLSMAIGKQEGRTPLGPYYQMGNFTLTETQKWNVIAVCYEEVCKELDTDLIGLFSHDDSQKTFSTVSHEYANTGFPMVYEIFNNAEADPYDALRSRIFPPPEQKSLNISD